MKISKWTKLMKLIILVLCLAFFAGCDGSGKDKSSWEEEVQLSNGTIIWIKREASFVSGEPLGGGGGYIDGLTNIIQVPANVVAPAPPLWREQDAVPMLLDYDEEKQTWFVVATFYMCGIWERWGKPMPPYRQYEVQNGEWIVVPLDEKLIGRQSNLVTGVVGSKVRRVTIEDRIRLNWNSGAKYKSIITTWDKC